MAARAAEEGLDQLKYQTWVLKVSIHCQGCKEQVKKILRNIDGVYTTDIDSRKHKVTVTGNVDSKTIVKKLAKMGKYAELWPEKLAEKEAKPSEISKSSENKDEPKIKEAGSGDQKSKLEEKPASSAKKSEITENRELTSGTGNNSAGKKKKKGTKGVSSMNHECSDNAMAGNGYPPDFGPNYIPHPQVAPSYLPAYYMPSGHAYGYYNSLLPSASAACSALPVCAHTCLSAMAYLPVQPPNMSHEFNHGDEEGRCCSPM